MKADFLTLMVTTHCTLRCAHCSLSIPHVPNVHYPFSELALSIRRTFQLYDFVGEFMISGGEAILHPDIVKIIQECSKYKEQYRTLKFYTNATVLPSEELMRCLKEHCIVRIDDYGIHSKADEWVRLCEEYGCRYETRDYRGEKEQQWQGGWLDIVGDLTNRNYTDSQIKEVFRKCQNRTNGRFIWAGRLWACGNSAGAALSSKIPDFADGFIDLLCDHFNAEELRAQINWADCDYLKACGYCNGFHSKTGKRIPAAVQMEEE